MSIWQKVVEIANRAMDTEANQILYELRATCPKDTGETARSFRIMSSEDDSTVSTIGGKGLIRSVRIGSTKLSAYYADQGNGGKSRIIRPKRAKALKLKDGSYRPYVHGYDGTDFVKWVADRHR